MPVYFCHLPSTTRLWWTELSTKYELILAQQFVACYHFSWSLLHLRLNILWVKTLVGEYQSLWDHCSFWILHSRYFWCKISVFRYLFSLLVPDTEISMYSHINNEQFLILLINGFNKWGRLASITRLVQILKSHKIFALGFFINPSALCWCHCLAGSKSYF